MKQELCGDVTAGLRSYHHHLQQQQYQQEQQQQLLHAAHPHSECQLLPVDNGIASQSTWSSPTLSAWHVPERPVLSRPLVIINQVFGLRLNSLLSDF